MGGGGGGGGVEKGRGICVQSRQGNFENST